MYIWDFAKDTFTKSFLVSHGCGRSSWGVDQSKEDPVVNNIPDSHCSSVGKYIIGDRAYSQWGINIKYWLKGMESTNNNAVKRLIVLHGWGKMTSDEIYPLGSAESWGCPAVSNEVMTYLDELLQPHQNDMLFWIFKD